MVKNKDTMDSLSKFNFFIGLMLIAYVGQSMAMLRTLAAMGIPIGGFMVFLGYQDNRRYQIEKIKRQQLKEAEKQMEESEEKRRLEEIEYQEKLEKHKKRVLKKNVKDCKGDQNCIDFAYRLYVSNRSRPRGRIGHRV